MWVNKSNKYFDERGEMMMLNQCFSLILTQSTQQKLNEVLHFKVIILITRAVEVNYYISYRFRREPRISRRKRRTFCSTSESSYTIEIESKSCSNLENQRET